MYLIVVLSLIKDLSTKSKSPRLGKLICWYSNKIQKEQNGIYGSCIFNNVFQKMHFQIFVTEEH